MEFVDPFETSSAPASQPKPAGPLKFVEPDFSKAEVNPAQQLKDEAMENALLNPWAAAALRGATFGLSDRAIALGQDFFDEGDTYSQHLADQFAQRDALNSEHPVGAFLTEMGGGVATGGPVVGLVKGAAKALLPRAVATLGAAGAGPTLGRIGAVLGGGAAAGGVAGAGQAEEGQVLEGAGRGALMGAATAGALKGVGKGVGLINRVASPMINRGATALSMTNPEKWAKKELADALLLDQDDMTKVAARLQQMDPNGTRGAMVMDALGVNAKSKLKAATIPSTTAKAELDDVLTARGLAQGERLTEEMRKAISNRFDVDTVAEDIYKAGREKAQPLYEQAKQLGVVDPMRVQRWFTANNNRKEILREYAKAAYDDGHPLQMRIHYDAKGKPTRVADPTVEDLMRIKDHFAELRNSFFDANGNRDPKHTVSIAGNKYGYPVVNREFNELRDMVRELTPDGQGGSLLARADEISGNSAEVRKALAKGKNIESWDSEKLSHEFGKLGSVAEQEAFRIGAAGKLFAGLERSAGGEGAVKRLNNPAIQKKLGVIFPDEETKAEFLKNMGTEAALARSQRQLGPRVSAGSAAMEREAADLSPLNAAVNAMGGRWGAAGNAVGRFFSNQWESTMPEYADPLLRLGMLKPEQAQALAKELSQRPGALSRLGSLGARGIGAEVRGAPYAAAGMLGSQSEIAPDLSKLLQEEAQ